MWGGVECTVNRVGDKYFDQLERSGHRRRQSEDLELFAGLGISALRTSLHWERFAAQGSWTEWDRLVEEMKRLDMRPIVGLLHHGSGPPSTNLLDPLFPEKLAGHALQVARRYPEVMDYTPVNEPQTTGRFACLYGYWYPHERSMRSYVRALYNEIKGVALAMEAIRTVQPEARLIHTEDAGQTFSTPLLETYRLEREHRRWLGTDLLCGCVDRAHPLYRFLLDNGLSEAEIFWFSENSCPPSVLGLNYYVTSDRFLDHRVDHFPGWGGGDTGDEPLVDVEAVRAHSAGIAGAGSVLRQAWQRYGLPVAITEAHLGCDPQEQVRWLAEVWREAQSARRSGVDVQAVTVWALLGSYDWCHLCMEDGGAYEPGVFDVREGMPVATPLAGVVRKLAHGERLTAAEQAPGWWRRQGRLTINPPEQVEPEMEGLLAAR